MKRIPKSLFYLAELSLVANFIILFSVSLNLDWVHTRAAGGQFDDFPIAIRVIYLVMAIATLFLMRFLVRLERAEVSERGGKGAKWLGILFVLSTFTQLISRSADERFNAIPAAIIAFAFLRASRSLKQAS